MGRPGGRQQQARGPPASRCRRRAEESAGPEAESGPSWGDQISRLRPLSLPAPSHVLQAHTTPTPWPRPSSRPASGSVPVPAPPRVPSSAPRPAPPPPHPSVPCSAPGADPASRVFREPCEQPGGLRGRRQHWNRGSLGDAAPSAILSTSQAPRTAGAGGPASRRPRAGSRHLPSSWLVRGFYLERVRLPQPRWRPAPRTPCTHRLG